MEAFLGFCYGLAIAAIVTAVLAVAAYGPQETDRQFTKDCKAMAHGTVSGSFCMKGNTVLFRK